jgi:DNA-binding NarL/FixJ family response regulator
VIRVLLVDDQELVRAGLRGILRPQFGFEIAGECADGTEVLDGVAKHQPDIVLMDVRMPVLDGVAATRVLRAEHPSVPVLALTTFDDDEALAGMLRAGAAGFVLKGIPAEDLHRAVAAVATGGAWLDPAVTARVLAVYRASPPGPAVSPAALDQHPPGTRCPRPDRPRRHQHRDRPAALRQRGHGQDPRQPPIRKARPTRQARSGHLRLRPRSRCWKRVNPGPSRLNTSRWPSKHSEGPASRS